MPLPVISATSCHFRKLLPAILNSQQPITWRCRWNQWILMWVLEHEKPAFISHISYCIFFHNKLQVRNLIHQNSKFFICNLSEIIGNISSTTFRHWVLLFTVDLLIDSAWVSSWFIDWLSLGYLLDWLIDFTVKPVLPVKSGQLICLCLGLDWLLESAHTSCQLIDWFIQL